MKFKNGNGLLKWIIEIMFRGFGNEWNESVDKSEREYDTNGKKFISCSIPSISCLSKHTPVVRRTLRVYFHSLIIISEIFQMLVIEKKGI